MRLTYSANKKLITGIYGGPYRPKVDKEWCDGGHWKLKDKPCEVCEAREEVTTNDR
jgi:hypothetical protein